MTAARETATVPATAPARSPSQFRLLAQRRFLPFFGAQALGAFNDNVYRNVLVILIAFHGASSAPLPPDVLTNLAGGVFILPFVLLSGLAGQIADRFDKSRIVQAVSPGIGFCWTRIWAKLLAERVSHAKEERDER